jgi:hypothetical protein
VKARVLSGTEWSALREATFTVPGHAAALAITEIMYRPLKDEVEGIGELEFLELKNTGLTPIDLSGLRFTNGIRYVFPNGRVLAPGEFLVLAENEGHFDTRYGMKPSEVYLRKLSNDGERLTIRDALHNRVFSVHYGVVAPWPILPNGHGFSLVPVDPHGNPDPDDPANWRASASTGGSPGEDDPEPLVPAVFVTEALAHTDLPLADAIEIFNPNESAVDITGWYLTDKLSNPRRWRIPPTIIEPGEYVVFYESDESGNVFDHHFGNAFGLSASGEEVYIVSADAEGNLTGFSHGFAFGASENGVSFGRYITSIGEEHFPPQKERTLGGPNVGPKVGPVVITELMYNPAGTNDQFIELMNITAAPVKLYDPAHPANTWRIGGVGYTFPTGIEVAPGEVLLVVQVEPETLRHTGGHTDLRPVFGESQQQRRAYPVAEARLTQFRLRRLGRSFHRCRQGHLLRQKSVAARARWQRSQPRADFSNCLRRRPDQLARQPGPRRHAGGRGFRGNSVLLRRLGERPRFDGSGRGARFRSRWRRHSKPARIRLRYGPNRGFPGRIARHGSGRRWRTRVPGDRLPAPHRFRGYRICS